MAEFLSDTFTAGSTVNLTAHSPETGGAWVKHPSFSGGINCDAAGYATGTIIPTGIYYNAADPGSDDYEVSAYVWEPTTNSLPGLMARLDTSAATFVQAYADRANAVISVQESGGSITNYSASIEEFSPGKLLTLKVEGTTATVTYDGVELGSITIAVTGRGRAGIRARSGAIVDNLSAQTVGSVPDTVAPILSSATGTAGVEGATGSVTTNEGNGTLYAVLTTSDTAPSVAQIQAGQDHTGAAASFAVGSGAGQSVNNTGAQNVTATGLAVRTTYYWHFQHRDSSSNNSTVVTSSGFTTPAKFSVVENATWTWFTDPRAITYNGATYIGAMSSTGDVQVHKYINATGEVSSFTLAAAFEDDDHNNPGLVFKPDGTLVAFYAKHNDTTGLRMRVASASESIAAWDAQTTVVAAGGAPISYANPHYLSVSGHYHTHFRSGSGGGGSRMAVTSTDDLAAFSTTFPVNAAGSGITPYWISESNGVNTIHFIYTDRHPVQATPNPIIYHVYAVDDGSGVLSWHESDGASIATPFAYAAGTVVYDGTSGQNCWIWDITLDSSGHPRVLYAQFPTTTDHRLYFTRWDGTSWTTPVQVCAMGSRLYAVETYYSMGASFHDSLPNTVFVGRESSGSHTVERWTSADNGATWVQAEILSPASATKKARPISPENAASELVALWWEGAYSTYINFDTDLFGSSGDVASAPVITLSNLTFSSRTATSITPRLDVTVS